MRKLWRVAAEELRFYLRQWSFYLSLFGFPLLFAAFGFAPEIGDFIATTPLSDMETIVTPEEDSFTERTGYVDHAGLISFVPEEQAEVFLAFDDETAARTALQAEEIVRYFVIPADYFETGEVAEYSLEAQLFSGTRTAINRLIRANLLRQLEPPALGDRLSDPVEFVYEGPPPLQYGFIPASLDLGRLASAGLALGVFAYAITGAGNFLLRALEREVSADILEVIMTTVTPAQFIGGKLLGISLLVFLQSGTILLAGAIFFGRTNATELGNLPLMPLLLSLPLLLLGYIGFSAVVMGISATWPNARENATIMAVVRLGALAPVMGVLFIIPNPEDLPALFLSLIPFTSPLLMSFRLLIVPVPLWQWLLSLLLLLGWTSFLVWFSIRMFRANMLLAGGFTMSKLRWFWRG